VVNWSTGTNSVADHTPSVTSGGTATFTENATGTVYTATGSDPDAGTTLSWSLSGTDADLFDINATTGAVTFKTAPNYEAPADDGKNNVYDITLTASDGVFSSAEKSVTITVTNANEAPIITSAATASFAENATGTAYTATGSDPDAGTTLSWSLGGTDAALFNINDTTGAVTFKAAPDYEAPADDGKNNVYDIIVTASDGVSSPVEKSVTITVTNIDEAILGASGSDTLTGTAQDDTIQGFDGADKLSGLAGADVLSGGSGNDTLDGGSGNDTLDGGTGDDLALLSGIEASYRFGVLDGVVITSHFDGVDLFTNIEHFQWGDAAQISINSLAASEANQGLIRASLDGGQFEYRLPDAYVGPVFGIVNQQIFAGGNDIALGTSKADFINGGKGDDAIDGGAGDDVLDGGQGSNFLTGGQGRDIFFLDGRTASNTPTWTTITDFSPGESLTIWGHQPGVSKFNWVESAGAAGYQGATLHGDLDGNGTTDTSVTFSGLTQGQLPTPLFGTVGGDNYIFFQ
jgi:serralysin